MNPVMCQSMKAAAVLDVICFYFHLLSWGSINNILVYLHFQYFSASLSLPTSSSLTSFFSRYLLLCCCIFSRSDCGCWQIYCSSHLSQQSQSCPWLVSKHQPGVVLYFSSTGSPTISVWGGGQAKELNSYKHTTQGCGCAPCMSAGCRGPHQDLWKLLSKSAQREEVCTAPCCSVERDKRGRGRPTNCTRQVHDQISCQGAKRHGHR